MDEIHIQSFVVAPPERVWDRLMARPDVVLDALPLREWPAERVEERPGRVTVTWPVAGAPTALEIAIGGAPGHATCVDLRHSGWERVAGAEDAIPGHFAGWLQALAALGLLVETGKDPRASSPELAGRERYFASGELPAGADAVFRALTDPDVLARWSQGAMDGTMLVDAVENRYARWTTAPQGGSGGGEVVMILRPTPRGTHCAIAEYGVVGRAASGRWPKLLERLAQFLH